MTTVVRRICIDVQSPLFAFEDLVKVLQSRFNDRIKFIATTTPVLIGRELYQYKLFLQFTQCISHAIIIKFMSANGMTHSTFSDFDEPYDVQEQWGSFKKRGRRLDKRLTPNATMAAGRSEETLDELKAKCAALEEENALLKTGRSYTAVQGDNNVVNSNNRIQVVINNFGSETFSHIDAEQIVRMLTPYVESSQRFETDEFIKLTVDWGEAVYAEPKNRNIKCRRKDGHAQILVDGKWKTFPRREKTVEAFDNLRSALREHGTTLCNEDVLNDPQVVMQCLYTAAHAPLDSNQHNRDKDYAMCDIIENCR